MKGPESPDPAREPQVGDKTIMRRSLRLLGLPILLMAALAACDSATDLSEVTVTGQWDGVGPMQEAFSGARMFLTESADGEISGSWRRGGLSGSVAGHNQGGDLEITLLNFEVGTVTFDGRFTDRYRMEGLLNGTSVETDAVFRRVNF